MGQLEDIKTLLEHATFQPVLLVAVALFVIYSGVTTYISYRRLAHIPGPRLAAVSELWFFNATSKGDLYLEAERVLRQYGLFHR